MDDAALRDNVIGQRDRLLEQLKDMEELREELDQAEYDAMKKDTIAQLKDFDVALAKMVAGNMTLQSEFDATRMAVRAAISEAFKTPEVIRMFATKEAPALRRRLAEIDRDVKLGKMEFAAVADQVRHAPSAALPPWKLASYHADRVPTLARCRASSGG